MHVILIHYKAHVWRSKGQLTGICSLIHPVGPGNKLRYSVLATQYFTYCFILSIQGT